nr:SH3 domain-containing protein [Pararhizobium antarcticum]
MRIGSSFENSVKWLYTASGLPLEIIEEYGNWRLVRDCDGTSGWMHRSLLSALRTAIVGPWKVKSATLYSGPFQSSGIAALPVPIMRRPRADREEKLLPAGRHDPRFKSGAVCLHRPQSEKTLSCVSSVANILGRYVLFVTG